MTTAAPAVTPEIRLDNLEKRFGDVLAVDHVSLDVGAGEFFSLLGPSGCGKTTTLRMIGGFELPTGGRILLRDRDMTREPPDKRPVNMVFQHYALFPHLTVGDNVAFGPKRKGLAKDEVRRRVGDALALVRLDGFEKRKPNQLSGGQQQRVALARALANRPDVLLLDEPLGALDLKLRRQLQVELKRIQSEVGITFVYVTHDQEEALTMSDRIAVMNAGQVEQLGTPEELYERPATRFVADFIGTTNLLRATVDVGWPRRLDTGETVSVDVGGHRGRERDRDQHPAGVDPAAPRSSAKTPFQPGSNRRPTWATRVSYLVRTTGGTGLTILASKAGHRLPVGSDVAVAWDAADALVLGRGPAPSTTGGTCVSHSHDGSSIDLERELVRHLAERRISRRYLLDRIAVMGAAAALAPVIAACTRSVSQPPADPAGSPPPERCRRHARTQPTSAAAASADRRPRRRRSRRPRASCSSTTGPTTWARTSFPGSRRSTGIKVTLRLLRQLRHDARQDRPGRRRLRHHVPDLDRRSRASSSAA